jgi:hypothetical protein
MTMQVIEQANQTAAIRMRIDDAKKKLNDPPCNLVLIKSIGDVATDATVPASNPAITLVCSPTGTLVSLPR